MTSHEERKQVIALLKDTIKAGARQAKACDILGLSERTLQRWQTDHTVRCDQRPLRNYQPPHKLTEIERAQVLTIAVRRQLTCPVDVNYLDRLNDM